MLGRTTGIFNAGGNFHDNQINVGLAPRQGRVPGDPTTNANAHVTNAAGYAQESFTLGKHWLVGAGIRYDEFRYGLHDRLDPLQSGVQWAGRWQSKGFVTYTPSRHLPLSFHLNYGRGMNSADARGVIQRPDDPRLATTDFYQAGAAWNTGRLSLVADTFLIDHSNEQVYIPDDGTIEFKGPTRAYGYEGKASFHITRYLSVNAGLTKVSNAFYRGGDYRVYVDSAPHLVANAALTLGGWHGWSGSVRMRGINHYRLDGEDPSILATGNTVFDLSVAKALNRHVELNFALENFTDRAYYETQNYFESRVGPDAPIVARIHGTPGYPLTAIGGVTFRFGGK
jgi:outer membrane receptor protein involved in Fe transport